MTETIKNNKSLSIRVTPNGLSFCSYTPTAAEPFVYREYDVQPTISLAANLKEALTHDPMLKDVEYQRVNVLVTSPKCTYVPVADFRAEDAESIFACNFPKDTQQRVSYNVLRRSGIAIIFGLDRNVFQLIVDDFPKARFYASASTLIEFFGQKSLLGMDKKMFCYLHEKEMSLYVFHEARMLLANSYPVTAVEDYMYYILNVMQQMDFSQLEDSLLIVGDTNKEGELLIKIQNFVKNVKVIAGKDDFRQSITGGNSRIPYDLQTLLICGF